MLKKFIIMKKKLFALLSISVLFFTTSCTSDDDSSEGPIGGIHPSGSYWPLALGNYWDFEPVNPADDDVDLEVQATETHNNQTYYSFDAASNNIGVGLLVRELNDVFIMYQRPMMQQGVTTSGGEIDFINLTNQPNVVWTDVLTMQITGAFNGNLNFNHEGKILPNETTMVVRGRTYQNVVKHQTTQTIFNSLSNVTQVVTSIYWLAKGIGPIKQEFVIDGETTVYELESYGLY